MKKGFRIRFISGKNEKAKKKWFIVLALAVLISIVTMVFFGESIFNPNFNKYNQNRGLLNSKDNVSKIPMSFDSFGSCLKYINATMYGAFWCPHCQNQKLTLGKDFNGVNYIECSNLNGSQNEACNLKNINGYPTWDIKGQRYEGEKTREQLSQLTGCSINSIKTP